MVVAAGLGTRMVSDLVMDTRAHGHRVGGPEPGSPDVSPPTALSALHQRKPALFLDAAGHSPQRQLAPGLGGRGQRALTKW